MNLTTLTEKQIEALEAVHLYEHTLEERFDDLLNSIHEVVIVCGYHHEPAKVLKEVDPIAYRQEYLNWLDNEITEGIIFELNGEYYSEDPEEVLAELEQETE